MKRRLNSVRAQAQAYIGTLGDTISETTVAAHEYAREIEEIVNNVQDLDDQECRERLDRLRTTFTRNLSFGSRFMGLGATMESNSATMVTGVAFIAAGLFLAYMGRRIFEAFLAVSGFIVFSSTAIILTILAKSHLSVEVSSLALWGIGLVAGLIGAVVFNKAWKFGVYCLSCYGGTLLAFWALGMVPEIKDYINKTVFIIACSTTAGCCAHYMDEMVVIVSSSLAGAFTAFFGLDMVNPLGFRANLISAFETLNSVESARDIAQEFLTGNVRNYMIGVLFVTVTGVYVQYRYQPRSYDRD